ncbi:uncharacterized protein FIBRA_04005 [Fibroporia radiculosa]|uniref:Uncharacterized protein n=1 Tax=Fibroporia radiculosa TaxID=599839 RepID=J4HWA7_9APHY|nr:uncharacterized protein FIBRA_04005 [Fibroporia radiculosa]CCM01932.1 predicted protein [Fibroporia radiculosa]
MYFLALPLLTGVFAKVVSAAPFTPTGGLDTNSSSPVYQPLSDFDFQSLNLALYQEFLELDLFHHGLAEFSAQEFEFNNITMDDQFIIEYMADQELGHAILLTNILGPNNASKPCNYSYPVETAQDFIQFSEMVTRVGEAGAYGFLEHLDSRAAAQLILQTVTVEARQEMIFRQLQGIFPMPFAFNPAITQSMQWTLIAPFIVSCPAENNRVEFQNFPALNITNNPNFTMLSNSSGPTVSVNETAFSTPGQSVSLSWESPGIPVGPNNSYTTNTTAGTPQFVAWISQLNTTYTPLTNVSNNTGVNTGVTQQPGGTIYGDGTSLTFNGTLFVLVTDSNITVTPANISLLNSHVVAGPAVYRAG